VVDPFELDEHERIQLLEACRIADRLDALRVLVDREGVVIASPQGAKAHPALVEARQQGIALARILAALRLPSGEEGGQKASARPQRRVGARGVYGIRGVAK
jgi:hypothetical protein